MKKKFWKLVHDVLVLVQIKLQNVVDGMHEPISAAWWKANEHKTDITDIELTVTFMELSKINPYDVKGIPTPVYKEEK